MDSFKRFIEELLHNKEYFYRSVKHGITVENGGRLDSHISDEEYLTCKKFAKKLAWKIWVIITISIWKKRCFVISWCFWKVYWRLTFYGLDPCHYFISPGLSLNAILKMTEIEFEKISNIDKYLLIEKGRKGGISYIAKRYAKASNKYMKDYDLKSIRIYNLPRY